MAGRSIESEAELYPYLGELVYRWSQLEFYLTALLAAVLGITVTEATGLFYSAVGNQTRFDMLRGAILSRLPRETGEGVRLRDNANALVDKAQKLNRTRNKFIHSLYLASREGVHICSVFPVEDDDGEIVAITADVIACADIKNHCQAVTLLQEKVIDFASALGGDPQGELPVRRPRRGES